MDNSLKVSDLIECPLCGHDEFVVTGKAHGIVKYRQKFNGTASEKNTGMYDKLKIEYTKVYCTRCGGYLGNYKTNECSSKAKAALGAFSLI